MRQLLALAFVLSVTISINSQNWVELRKQNKSFFEVQEAFEAQWANKEYEKGKGYKQFKRWEYFMEPRVNDEGFLPSSAQNWQEYQKYAKAKNQNPNKSADWTFSGPLDINSSTKGIGRVNVVEVDPTNSNIIYAGVPGGGLWKTTNGGNTWSPKTDDLPNVGVTGIAIDYTNPQIIYIGTGDGDANDTYSLGVMKSVDGGDTWSTTGLNYNVTEQRNVHRLIIHPEDPNILLVGTTTSLLKTTNGGENWFGILSGNIYDVEFHPTNPDIIYACSQGFSKSEDGGATFDQITSGLPATLQVSRASIAVSPDEPDWIYFLAGGTDFGLEGVYRSTNTGVSFTERADGTPNLMGWSESGFDSGGQAWYDIALAVNPDDANQVFVGGVNLWRSTNGGSSWTLKAHWLNANSNAYVHADIHFLHFFNDSFFCGSDGGIFRSTNDGNSFGNLSAGLGITQIYGIGTTDQNPNIITLGSQDNGTNMTSGGSWSRVFGGDGLQTHIHPNNTNRIYCATQQGNLYFSNNGGSNFNNYSNPIEETGAWLTPYELKPSNPNVVIAGFQNIWEYNNGWTQLSDFNSPTIANIALAESDNDYIYFSSSSSIHKTTNYGDTWNNMNEELPSLNISGIEVDPMDADHVYVTLSQYEAGEKVYETTDGGETWNNISFNLPNVPANCLALDGDGGIYVGTDLGVFFKNDDLSNWQTFGEGMPVVVVTDLDILPNNNIIRAATYGRSVWDSPLYTPIALAPEVDFVSDVNSICAGHEVAFSDFSFNASPDWNWSFEGGTPSTSNDPNPTVIYNETGTFQVSLTMTNPFGSDTETKTTYIFVLDDSEFTVPFEEGFEGVSELPNNDWFIRNDDNNETFQLNTEVGHSGNNSISLNNNLGSVGEFDELISHPFDLTGAQGTEFTYWYAHAQRNEDNNGKLWVHFSSNCGDSWQLQGTNTAGGSLDTAEPTEDYFIPSDDEWDTDSENINDQYWGPDFRFRFRYRNDGGNVLYLDDINISGFVGIEDYALGSKSILAYPNPANDMLNIRLQQDGETQIELRNLLGQVIMVQSLKTAYGEQVFTLDISNIENGVYQLEVISELGVDAVQIVIKR